MKMSKEIIFKHDLKKMDLSVNYQLLVSMKINL